MRFAVLHHSGIEEPHFDFMFETADGSQLTTFRLPRWPLHENTEAVKLRDHRRAYLTLQGDISLGRGHVERVDEGSIQVGPHSRGWKLSHEDGRPFASIEPLGTDPQGAWLFCLARESSDS